MGVVHNRLNVADTKPQAAEIAVGEIVINEVDKLLYSKDTAGTVISVGGSGSGGGSFITQNENVLAADFALNAGESGVTTSFTINDGIKLTIPNDSILAIV